MWKGTKEHHSSQGNTKLMMETDTYESINPETDNVNTLGNPNTTLPPHEPAPSEEPLDQTTRQPQWGLHSSAPQGGWHQTGQDLWTEKSDQTEPGATQPMVRILKTESLLTILVFDLWLCIFLIFRTRDRIFRLQEKRS